MARIERVTQIVNHPDETRTEIVSVVTSLTPEKADAEQLLAHNRGHWSIENKKHYVLDVAFDEDRSQIRTRNGPRIMNSLRGLAIGLIGLACPGQSVPSATREFARKPHLVMGLIGV